MKTLILRNPNRLFPRTKQRSLLIFQRDGVAARQYLLRLCGIFGVATDFLSHQNHKNNMMIMKMVDNLRDDHNKMIAELEQKHKNIFIPILVTRNTSFLFFECSDLGDKQGTIQDYNQTLKINPKL
jgi:hypothetical protein